MIRGCNIIENFMYQFINQNLQAFYQNRENKGHFASFINSIKIKNGRLK